ncbi:MAG: RNA 2',3'-cyclic phosphodiesterase [Chloroflexota bacterium]
METIRTFVAIHLPPTILKALAELQGRLQRGPGGAAGRWMRPEGIHLTLQFLGDMPRDQLARVFAAVDHACAGRKGFDYTVGRLGCFPNARRPRVVWVSLREETGQLADLQRAIAHELALVGFPPEQRPFAPHLTLARVRQEAPGREIEALGTWVTSGAASRDADVGDLGMARAASVHVMRSDLRPTGALYTSLHETPLQD